MTVTAGGIFEVYIAVTLTFSVLASIVVFIATQEGLRLDALDSAALALAITLTFPLSPLWALLFVAWRLALRLTSGEDKQP